MELIVLRNVKLLELFNITNCVTTRGSLGICYVIFPSSAFTGALCQAHRSAQPGSHSTPGDHSAPANGHGRFHQRSVASFSCTGEEAALKDNSHAK